MGGALSSSHSALTHFDVKEVQEYCEHICAPLAPAGSSPEGNEQRFFGPLQSRRRRCTACTDVSVTLTGDAKATFPRATLR
jgi:hypothetical protein